MGGLLLKLQNFKKVKSIFGHPVFLYVKSRNFPPSCQISHESDYQITLFFPPCVYDLGIVTYYVNALVAMVYGKNHKN